MIPDPSQIAKCCFGCHMIAFYVYGGWSQEYSAFISFVC